MDSKDSPQPSVPAVPLRSALARSLATDAAGARGGAPPSPGSVNILRVALRAVTRHWWQILGLWVVGTGGLWYLINANIKPVYDSASILRVEPSQRDLFGAGGGGEAFEPFLETQVQLMTSPNVLGAALADPKTASLKIVREAADPEAEIRRRLQVTLVPRSYLIRVAMTSPSSSESAAAVNSVVDAYLKTAAEWADGTTRAQIKNLEAYQRELKSQADEREEAWLALAAKGNIDLQAHDPLVTSQPGNNLPVPTRSRITLEEYKGVRDQLLKINIELARAEAILTTREAEARAQPKARPAEPRSEQRLLEAFRSDPEAVALAQQIAKTRLKYETASRGARNQGDPSVTRPLHELDTLNRRYTELFEAKREALTAQAEGRGLATPDGALAVAREEVNKLRASKKSYESALEKLDVVNKQEGTDAVKIAIVRDDLGSLKGMQEAVVKRLEQLRFESRDAARINRITEARATGVPVGDNRVKYMTYSPALVLAVLLGLFVMLELKIGRVSDLEELSRHSPVEVFAVPPLPGPRLEPGRKGAREREARLQEFLQTLDHLRVALCGEEPTAGVGRCLLITSATAGEGKTTLSAQLAACCAKAGHSTLVIDADLRRATLSRILNEEETPGLSDVLLGKLDPDAAPVALPDAGFHFLPAGGGGRDPSWLLKNQRIGQLLTRYRQSFDIVIIDTPPVLPVPDALTIGRWADGVVLTTRFDVSRFPLVERARKRIASANIPLLKTVVNGVRTSRFSYGYGSHGYGYGYGGYGAYGGGDRAVGAAEPTPSSPSA